MTLILFVLKKLCVLCELCVKKGKKKEDVRRNVEQPQPKYANLT
jgi:tmRNA-binding protein